MNNYHFSFFIFCLLALPICLFAQENSPRPHEIGLRNDNDVYLFVGQDRYYTNGLYVYYNVVLPQPEKALKTAKNMVGFEFGQAIYNPRSAYVRNFSRIDRPFAGYLYGGLSFSRFSTKQNRFKVMLQAGQIGPKSGAEKIQKWYHHTIGFDPPVGWQTQINNAFGLNLNFEYAQSIRERAGNKNRINNWLLDSYIKVGQFFNGAGVGAIFRTGRLEKMHQSGFFNAASYTKSHSKPMRENFFFLKPMLNAILYDATMQGAVNQSDNPFTFKPYQLHGSMEIGGFFGFKHWQFEFRYTLKTPENRQMNWNLYGSIRSFVQF